MPPDLYSNKVTKLVQSINSKTNVQGKFSLKYSSRDHGVQLHSLKLILIILLSWMLQQHANMIGNVDFYC